MNPKVRSRRQTDFRWHLISYHAKMKKEIGMINKKKGLARKNEAASQLCKVALVKLVINKFSF